MFARSRAATSRRSPTSSPAGRWIAFADFEDEVTDVELDGEDLYLLVNKGTPRGRLVKTSASAPNLATAAVVVPQGSDVIEGTCARARWHLSAHHGRRHQPLAPLEPRRTTSPKSRCPSTAPSARCSRYPTKTAPYWRIKAGSRPRASGRWTCRSAVQTPASRPSPPSM